MPLDGRRVLRPLGDRPRSVCAPRFEPPGERGVGEGQHAGGQQPGVDAPLAIASVPTGTPAGICTIESRESSPPSALVGTGTPNTGNVV